MKHLQLHVAYHGFWQSGWYAMNRMIRKVADGSSASDGPGEKIRVVSAIVTHRRR